MTDRYCTRCNATVEDAGGYCLLGHPLRHEAPVASLSDLRAEVDRAFEEARQVVSAVASGPPPPPAPPSSIRIEIDDLVKGEGVDPITEFAPAPRMDWGPEREGRLRRR